MKKRTRRQKTSLLYKELRGKIVDRVEHDFEEGRLYLHVCFTDNTELCWRVTSRLTIEERDLIDWSSGDSKPLKVFIRHENDRDI